MEKIIGTYMIKSPYVAEMDAGLQEARDTMVECGIRHLPVIESGRLVGLLSERDLRGAIALPQSETLSVADVMKRDVFVARKSAPLKDIIKTMEENKLGSTVIVNERDEVLGIFTVIDALRILGDLLEDESTEDLFVDDFYDAWESAV